MTSGEVGRGRTGVTRGLCALRRLSYWAYCKEQEGRPSEGRWEVGGDRQRWRSVIKGHEYEAEGGGMGDADWVGVVGKLGSGRVGWWYVYCTYLISKVAIACIGPDSRRNSQ